MKLSEAFHSLVWSKFISSGQHSKIKQGLVNPPSLSMF